MLDFFPDKHFIPVATLTFILEHSIHLFCWKLDFFPDRHFIPVATLTFILELCESMWVGGLYYDTSLFWALFSTAS